MKCVLQATGHMASAVPGARGLLPSCLAGAVGPIAMPALARAAPGPPRFGLTLPRGCDMEQTAPVLSSALSLLWELEDTHIE